VPVPAVGEVAASIGGPGHHVPDPGWDLVITAGTPVRLVAGRYVTHQPFAIRVGLHPLHTTAYPIGVERRRFGLSAAVVAAG
jgi:hypothetical protein